MLMKFEEKYNQIQLTQHSFAARCVKIAQITDYGLPKSTRKEQQ
jgi:hypothetical protein